MSEQLRHEEWKGRTDGTNWMHRWLIASLKFLNLRFVYTGMAVFVIPFYMLFSHKSYIAMYHYFRHHHHYGPLKAFCYVYLNHFRFGQIIIDRFAAYAGMKFQFEIEGGDMLLDLCQQEPGFVILSSHVGNYELAGYAFKSETKRYCALVFSGEAQTVMANRDRLLSENNITMIPVKDDMSHVFAMSNALSNGDIVSIPADRIFGSPRYVECDFLGSKAHFPLGPYAMALQRDVPTLAIFIMKESTHKYKGYIRRIQIDSCVTTKNRTERAAALAQSYVNLLEDILRQYPEQWFNYYEFWQTDGE